MVLHIGRLCSLIIASCALALPAAATDDPDVDIQVEHRIIEKWFPVYIIHVTNVGSTGKVEVKKVVVNERDDCPVKTFGGNKPLALGDTHSAIVICNPIRISVETSNGTYRAAFKP